MHPAYIGMMASVEAGLGKQLNALVQVSCPGLWLLNPSKCATFSVKFMFLGSPGHALGPCVLNLQLPIAVTNRTVTTAA